MDIAYIEISTIDFRITVVPSESKNIVIETEDGDYLTIANQTSDAVLNLFPPQNYQITLGETFIIPDPEMETRLLAIEVAMS